MKRTASRDYTGTITVPFMPTPDLELLAEVDYRFWPDEPQTRDEPGCPSECELVTKRVYHESVDVNGAKVVKELTGAAGTFDWFLSLAPAFRDSVEQQAGRDCTGSEEAALEAHYESKREERRGL